MRIFSIAIIALCYSFAPVANLTLLVNTAAAQTTLERNEKSDTPDGNSSLMELLNSIKSAPPDYKTLTRAADVILIGKLQETLPQPDADYRDSTVKSIEANNDVLLSTKSQFEVRAILKGDVGKDRVAVAHLTWKPNVVVLDGTSFVTFHKTVRIPWLVNVNIEGKSPVISGDKSVQTNFTPEYLLFLKRRSDGLFEPASGQRNALASVRIINLLDP
jgi:hypothetical protein